MKKCIFFINLIVLLLAISIIPLDLFLINIPKWVSLISILVIVGLIIFIWYKSDKLVFKIVLSVIDCLFLLTIFIGTYCNPYWNSVNFKNNTDYQCKDYKTVLTLKEAKQDLDYAMNYLNSVHPAFIKESPDNIESLYSQAIKNLENNDNITINDVCKEIEQIFSSLGDGHTAIHTNYPEYHYLKYKDKCEEQGYTLVSINGESLEEIFKKKSNLFSYETESYGLSIMKTYLSTEECLNYLGYDLKQGITYTYKTEDGSLIQCTYYPKDFVSYEEYQKYNNFQEENNEDDYSFVKYEIDEQSNLAILTLNSCQYDDEYKKCLNDMFSEIQEKGINNVCVDLRNNGGGNSLVADEFIHYLDVDSYKSWGQDLRLGLFLVKSKGETVNNKRYEDLIFKGNVYVLTNIYTFSSAMDFAMLISDNNLGKIVGEASGNKPGGYGDVAIFKLPNSGLIMQVSTKKWYRIDLENSDELIEPDIHCDSEKALSILKEILNK